MPLADIRALLSAPDPETARTRLRGHQRWLEARIANYRRALTLLKTLDDHGDDTSDDTSKERAMEHDSTSYQCSFCGKANAEVKRMIAGPNGVFICDECVARCNEIIAAEEAATEAR
jgi:hypothetical protein